MANVITGKVFEIMAPREYQKKDGSKGWTQEIVVDAAQQRNGETYENYPSVEINDTIDGNMVGLVRIGAMLTFSFEVRGRYYQGQTGEKKHINTIRCYKVEPAVVEQRAPRAMAMPAQPSVAMQPNTAANTDANMAAPQRQQYAQPTGGFFNQQAPAAQPNAAAPSDDYPFPMV